MITYKTFRYDLAFRSPFQIAHTVRSTTPAVYLLLEEGHSSGWGEAAFPPYVAENTDTFESFIQRINLPESIKTLDVSSFLHHVEQQAPHNPFSLAALDIALHNLQESFSKISIRSRYGISGPAKESSYTLGISTKEEMRDKINLASEATYFKLKVNETEIERIIDNYLDLTDKPFVVDANQGFTSLDYAREWAEKLAMFGVAYFEQPFHKDDFHSHFLLKQQSPVSIIADESFQNIQALYDVKECFHGINIKLMKCGGLHAAHAIFQQAQEYRLKTVMGCMSEGSVAGKAAWQLAPLADWVDLDGPFLLKNDIFHPSAKLSHSEIYHILAANQSSI